jgi:hypothetical protein
MKRNVIGILKALQPNRLCGSMYRTVPQLKLSTESGGIRSLARRFPRRLLLFSLSSVVQRGLVVQVAFDDLECLQGVYILCEDAVHDNNLTTSNRALSMIFESVYLVHNHSCAPQTRTGSGFATTCPVSGWMIKKE